MAEFINTSEGYINLAHIIWVKFGIATEDGADLMQLTDGRLLRCHVADPVFKSGLMSQPAEPLGDPRPSTFLLGFSDPEQTVSPSDGDVSPGLQDRDPDPQKP